MLCKYSREFGIIPFYQVASEVLAKNLTLYP